MAEVVGFRGILCAQPLPHAAAIVAADAMGDQCHHQYAGIVLAGGQSSRMGQNKALMSYMGVPMVTHMMNILRQSGIDDIFISGAVEGFDTIPDVTPFAGPAQAICNVLRQKDAYDGYICVPVDMPLLTPEVLRILISQPQGGYFAAHPLPFFLKKCRNIDDSHSVRDFLDANQVPIIPLPDIMREIMVNTNTPEEWGKVLARQ